MSDLASQRVADADREQLASELREHMLAGRLTPEEFEDRLERAYKSATRGELEELRADLPMSPTAFDAALSKRRATLRRRLVRESGGAVGASLVSVGVWAASGAGEFWPAWVILATMVPVARNAWRLLGPAPDLDSFETRLRARRERQLARERHRHHHRGLPR